MGYNMRMDKRFDIVVINYGRLCSFIDNFHKIINFDPAKDRLTIISGSESFDERKIIEKFENEKGCKVRYIPRENVGMAEFARIQYFRGEIGSLEENLSYRYIFQMQEHYLDTNSPHSIYPEGYGAGVDLQIKGDVVPDNYIFDLNKMEALADKYNLVGMYCDRMGPNYLERNNNKYLAPEGGNFIISSKLVKTSKIQDGLFLLRKTFENLTSFNYRWAVFAELYWGELFFPEGLPFYDLLNEKFFTNFKKEEFNAFQTQRIQQYKEHFEIYSTKNSFLTKLASKLAVKKFFSFWPACLLQNQIRAYGRVYSLIDWAKYLPKDMTALIKKEKDGNRRKIIILGVIKIKYKKESIAKQISDKIFSIKSRLGMNVVIPYVEVCVTTKCTLRCKDCNNFNTHYYFMHDGKKLKDTPINELEKDFSKLLNSVDKILTLRIMGGEPFIYNNLDRLLDYLRKQPKLNNIKIVTNGTLIPKKEVLNSIIRNNISVDISDYDETSFKLNELTKILEENDITYWVPPGARDWASSGGLEYRNRTQEQLEKAFRDCGTTGCRHLVDGKLYICPRSAHGQILGLYPANSNDYVDLHKGSSKYIRKEIKRLLSIKSSETCNYCDGLREDSPPIPLAVQLSKEEIDRLKAKYSKDNNICKI